MKKGALIIALIFTGLSLVLYVSCKKNSKNDNTDPTPTPTVLMHVNAIIISGGNPTNSTSVSIGLTDINNSGAGVTGAIVRVNGMDIEDKGSGAYTLVITSNPICAGTNVTVLVRYAGTDYTVSAVMPESGGEIKVDFPGCHAGSYLALDNNV